MPLLEIVIGLLQRTLSGRNHKLMLDPEQVLMDLCCQTTLSKPITTTNDDDLSQKQQEDDDDNIDDNTVDDVITEVYQSILLLFEQIRMDQSSMSLSLSSSLGGGSNRSGRHRRQRGSTTADFNQNILHTCIDSATGYPPLHLLCTNPILLSSSSLSLKLFKLFVDLSMDDYDSIDSTSITGNSSSNTQKQQPPLDLPKQQKSTSSSPNYSFRSSIMNQISKVLFDHDNSNAADSVEQSVVPVIPLILLQKTKKGGSLLPIHIICRYSYNICIDIMEYLIRCYPSLIYISDSKYGNLPLHECCLACTTDYNVVPLEYILLLLQSWPQSCQTRNLDGNLPLHLAVQHCHYNNNDNSSSVDDEENNDTGDDGGDDDDNNLTSTAIKSSPSRPDVIESLDGMDTVVEEENEDDEDDDFYNVATKTPPNRSLDETDDEYYDDGTKIIKQDETLTTLTATTTTTKYVPVKATNQNSGTIRKKKRLNAARKQRDQKIKELRQRQQQSQLEMVQYLAEYWPDALYIPNKYGYTPIQVAAATFDVATNDDTMDTPTAGNDDDKSNTNSTNRTKKSNKEDNPIYQFLMEFASTHPNTLVECPPAQPNTTPSIWYPPTPSPADEETPLEESNVVNTASNNKIDNISNENQDNTFAENNVDGDNTITMSTTALITNNIDTVVTTTPPSVSMDNAEEQMHREVDEEKDAIDATITGATFPSNETTAETLEIEDALLCSVAEDANDSENTDVLSSGMTDQENGMNADDVAIEGADDS